MTFSASNIDQIESHLASHPYLSEGGLPGADDAQVFFDLGSNFLSYFRTPRSWKIPKHSLLVSFHQQLLKRFDEKVD